MMQVTIEVYDKTIRQINDDLIVFNPNLDELINNINSWNKTLISSTLIIVCMVKLGDSYFKSDLTSQHIPSDINYPKIATHNIYQILSVDNDDAHFDLIISDKLN